MAGRIGSKILYIILSVFLTVLAAGVVVTVWLSYHYKGILAKQLPIMVSKSTDSVYHLSFGDININLAGQTATITGIHLWPDKERLKQLKAQHRHVPPTVSTLSLPSLELSGINWQMALGGTLNCRNAIIHNLEWQLDCAPHPEDSLDKKDKQKKPYIERLAVNKVDLINPHITYHYAGARSTFSCFLKGGNVTLWQWAYNYDKIKDTSVFLYARSGKVRPDSFIFLKQTGIYTIKKPSVDFACTATSVTLKDIVVKQMVNHNPQTSAEKDVYDLDLPAVKLSGFNWNKLINNNKLHATEILVTQPGIFIRHIDENETPSVRLGSYPHQLLLQVALQTNLEEVNIKNGHLKYTEVTKNKGEAIIDLSGISGHLTNVTNMKTLIAHRENCVVSLAGKYMGKSPVSCTVHFYLGDTSGRFRMDGVIKDLAGDQVIKQAQAFTLAEVTSFHLSKMDMHLEGDETYARGNFTILYEDLKISLLKFKSKMRTGKNGPLSFLGSALILYPSNPLKDNPARTVSTSFARDPKKGFVNAIWKNVYRAAQKTAVRNEALINATNEKESEKGEAPRKKGFLGRLFGKKT